MLNIAIDEFISSFNSYRLRYFSLCTMYMQSMIRLTDTKSN